VKSFDPMSDAPPLPDYPLACESRSGETPDPVSRESFVHRVRRVDALNPDWPRIGKALLPRDELLRFRHVPHLVFAPSTLAKSSPGAARRDGKTVEELMVYFMGMLGPGGPLPGVYTDVVLSRAKGVPHPDLPQNHVGESAYRPDKGPAAFIDQFNHRFISLFYRASVSADKAVDYDRPAESRFHHYIGSFLGIGMDGCQDRMDVPDPVALYFSGHLSCPTRHAEGLCGMVADYCGVEVKLVPNVGHWVEIPSANRSTLGGRSTSGGLGDGAILGGRFWDRTMKFRLNLGPMSFADYQGFAPGGTTVRALKSLVLLYCGHELACEIRLFLKKEETPRLRLGGGGALGFSTWLMSGPAAEDPDQYYHTLT
jgi:type VI secretion system protein ImpH